MDYTQQFKPLVKVTVRKNQYALPDMTREEIEAECWAAVAAAIQRWDGSKGKLATWVYTAVTGRMKDLRKRPALTRPQELEYTDFSAVEYEIARNRWDVS